MRLPASCISAALVCCFIATRAARAQTSPPAGAEAGKSWRDLVCVEGLVDAYYAYRPGGSAIEPSSLHVFDAVSDSFVVAYAELAVGVKPEPVGLRLDLGFGPVADATASNAGALTETFKHLQQAYVTFAVPTAVPLTVDFGKFVTPVGAEVIEARSNWSYSRSFLFDYAIPFTHTGLRVTAALAPRFALQALLVNGWDLVFDNNRAKTFGLSAMFHAPTGTSVALSGLAGNEQPPAGGSAWRLLADLVVGHELGPVGLMLNADFAKEGDAKWYGAAAYVRVVPAPYFNVALRGEIFRDQGGIRLLPPSGVDTTVREATLTAAFPVGAHGELRAEARGDFSNQNVFVVGGLPNDHQFQFLAAALAGF